MSQPNTRKREIDTGKLFAFILGKWGILLAALIIGLLAGFVISRFVITPEYTSSTKIIILSRSDDKNGNITTGDLMISDYLTKDYQEMIKSRSVLTDVIKDLNLSDTYQSLGKRLSVNNVDNTRIITISVTDQDPAVARKTAVAIRQTATDFILSVTDIQAINVIEDADLPTSPSGPDVIRWTMTGGLLAFFVTLLWLFIRFISNNTIMTSDDVEQDLALPVLASIPAFGEDSTKNMARPSEKSKDKWVERDMSRATEEAALDVFAQDGQTKQQRSNANQAGNGRRTIRGTAEN